MPSARRKAFLLTFVAAWTKVRRLAVRELPTLSFCLFVLCACVCKLMASGSTRTADLKVFFHPLRQRLQAYSLWWDAPASLVFQKSNKENRSTI
jgi:hypothetical protein